MDHGHLTILAVDKIRQKMNRSDNIIYRPSSNERLLTVHETSIQLQVSSEQIRALIRKGQLSAINVGTGTKRPLYRITRQSLESFCSRRQQVNTTNHKRNKKRLLQIPDFFPDLK